MQQAIQLMSLSRLKVIIPTAPVETVLLLLALCHKE